MNQQPPNHPPFSRQPAFNRKRGNTGRLPALGGQGAQTPPSQPGAPPPKPSSLENTDSIQVTGQAGPGRKDPPPVVPRGGSGADLFSSAPTSVTSLEDGAKIVRYAQPQQLNRLLHDAKANIGGDSSRFYGKGWVIGQRIAKIASDGMSVTYYPQDISDLVRDLLGPDSETI